MKKILIIALFVIAALGIVGYIYLDYNNRHVETITIDHKERIVESTENGVKSYYLIFTNDNEYKVVDDYIYGVFNASHIYGKLNIGKTYKVTVVGRRIPYFSMYPRIIKINN